MPDSIIMWTIMSLLFLCFVMLIVLWGITRRLSARLQKSVSLIDELHKISITQNQQLSALEQEQGELSTELLTRQKQFEHIQAASVIRMEKVEDTVERLEEQDPALKMYSKASKLVEQGAAMSDIIEASGLPRAEVEVLLSLHSVKRKSSE
jgi:biopolymer transport protein ExbB/TolQ